MRVRKTAKATPTSTLTWLAAARTPRKHTMEEALAVWESALAAPITTVMGVASAERTAQPLALPNTTIKLDQITTFESRYEKTQ